MPPANLFNHTMDVTKNWDSDHRLDMVASVHTDVTIELYEGRIVHRDANGLWHTGCRADKVSFVLLNDSKAYGSVHTSQARNPNAGWQGYGKMNRVALCCLQAYEIATTEYDTTKTYAVDNYLTAKFADTDQDAGGLLTNVVPGTSTALTVPTRGSGTTKTICGIVSTPPRAFQNQQTLLSFYTVHMPGASDS